MQNVSTQVVIISEILDCHLKFQGIPNSLVHETLVTLQIIVLNI